MASINNSDLRPVDFESFPGPENYMSQLSEEELASIVGGDSLQEAGKTIGLGALGSATYDLGKLLIGSTVDGIGSVLPPDFNWVDYLVFSPL